MVIAVCYSYGVINYGWPLLLGMGLGVGAGGTIVPSSNLILLLKIITEPKPAAVDADYNCREEYSWFIA